MTSNFIRSNRGEKTLVVLSDFMDYKFRGSIHFVTWRCTFRQPSKIMQTVPAKNLSATFNNQNLRVCNILVLLIVCSIRIVLRVRNLLVCAIYSLS